MVEVANAVTSGVAIFCTTVSWRGRRYRVSRDGEVTRRLDAEDSILAGSRPAMRMLRADEWGVQLPILAIAAAVYAAFLRVDITAYVATVARVVLCTSLMLAGAYVFNDYCDRDDDRLKTGRRRGDVARPRRTLITAVVLFASGLVVARVFLPDRRALFIVAMQALAAIAYSCPPVRLKERGWMGAATATVAQRIPAFWLVAIAYPVDATSAATLTAWLAFVGALFILEHQIEDIDNDRRAGVRTLATGMGRTRARRLLAGGYAAFAVASVGTVVVVAHLRAPGSGGAAMLLAVGSATIAGLLRLRYRLRPEFVERLPVALKHDRAASGRVAERHVEHSRIQ